MISLNEIQSFFKGSIRLSEPLARYTTIQVGGPADYLLSPVDKTDQETLVRFLVRTGLPYFILDQDMLVSDDGFRGVIIVPVDGKPPSRERKLSMFHPVPEASIEELVSRVQLDGRTWGEAEVDGAYIRNRGNARASDILALVQHVQRTIRRSTAVHLDIKFPVVGFTQSIAQVA